MIAIFLKSIFRYCIRFECPASRKLIPSRHLSGLCLGSSLWNFSRLCTSGRRCLKLLLRYSRQWHLSEISELTRPGGEDLVEGRFFEIFLGISSCLCWMRSEIASIIRRICYLILLLSAKTMRSPHRWNPCVIFSLFMLNLRLKLFYLFFYLQFWKPFQEWLQWVRNDVQNN